MKFYEIHEPYYALIKARDEVDATKKYIEVVAGEEDEFEEILENCEQVSDYYAVAKFARSLGEDRELVEFNEVMEALKSNDTEILLMDGSLI